MNRTGAKLAFQLNPEQSIKHAVGENDVLASRKADVQMKDGSTRKVTLFFRTQPEELAKLQSEGAADSSQATAARLRTILLKQGANIFQVEQLFHHIRVHNHGTEKTENQLKQQFSRQPAPLERQRSFAQLAAKKMEDGWAKTFSVPEIPMNLVSSVFVKAMSAGKMLRVNSQMQESEPKPKPPPGAASHTPGTTTTTLTTQTTTTTTTTTLPIPPGGMPPLPPIPGGPSVNGPPPPSSNSTANNS